MIKICLDAGHGGSDVGAVGVLDFEKDYNINIVNLVEQHLRNYNCEIVKTRLKDEYVGLTRRADISNKNKCDVFISIHCNAFNTKARGFESYSYSMNKIQDILHNEIISSVPIKNRGQKENKKFTVLSKTKCKAVLLELCFIDSEEDTRIIEENMENYSRAIARGLIKYFGLVEDTHDCVCSICGK